MSVDPGSGRGGTPALDKIKRRGRLGKASSRSVIEDMSASSPLQEPELAQRAESQPPAPAQPAPQPIQQQVQQPAPQPVQQPVQEPVGQAMQQPVQSAPFVHQVPIPAVQQIPAQILQDAPAPVAAPVEAAPQQPEAESKKDAPKKASFFQSKEAGDRMRSTYNSTRPMTRYRTLSEFICAAVEKECARLEAQYNNGEPYDSDPDDVPRGRPVGG